MFHNVCLGTIADLIESDTAREIGWTMPTLAPHGTVMTDTNHIIWDQFSYLSENVSAGMIYGLYTQENRLYARTMTLAGSYRAFVPADLRFCLDFIMNGYNPHDNALYSIDVRGILVRPRTSSEMQDWHNNPHTR